MSNETECPECAGLPNYLQKERMLIAKYYWWYDYMKGENNTLK